MKYQLTKNTLFKLPLKLMVLKTYSDFYLYETKKTINKYIIDRWSLEGIISDNTKHLQIPKNLIFPLKMKEECKALKYRYLIEFQIYVNSFMVRITMFQLRKTWIILLIVNNKPYFFTLDNNVIETINIVIVTYNSSSTLKKCLDSVLNNLSASITVTVVDNNS